LKTIYRDPQKEVFSNVYGTTSLFTGKPCQLAAVAKDFAICYALDYSEFREVLKDEARDF
jgi:signal-transduction protein with cAMP-binding, CBS, and nucleotidyltransferase domain